MPRGDGTGPNGMGPMTGRSAGFCAGFGRPGYTDPYIGARYGFGGGFGRGFRGGFGRGFGGGFGRGFGYNAVPAYYGSPLYWGASSKEQELEALKTLAAGYDKELKEINKRIDELESESK
ncbi:MAG: hypothetical protein COT43_03270 [Candidatus Marinimicrobia bacterium CG08_land_8_20_14_0_20_45_22]|nr:MAG: hypothetical protein COT43_03270 [Candidatus Marinimicrobia bacterium CG08_land_8_20_14_0_20_45_22]